MHLSSIESQKVCRLVEKTHKYHVQFKHQIIKIQPSFEIQEIIFNNRMTMIINWQK